MEFGPVEDIMPENVTCNFAAAREHVGDIEREMHIIKEQGRSTNHISLQERSLSYHP